MRPSVQWFEIAGDDGGALRDFYRELFGWRIYDGAATPDFDYGLVEPGYGGIAGGIGTRSDGVTAHVTFFVEVDRPSDMLERVDRQDSDADSPGPGTSFEIAYLADPEGNIVGLTRGT